MGVSILAQPVRAGRRDCPLAGGRHRRVSILAQPVRAGRRPAVVAEGRELRVSILAQPVRAGRPSAAPPSPAGRPCFNPRPAREGRAAGSRTSFRLSRICFNPRPAREGRAALPELFGQRRAAVSILAQPVRAGRPRFQGQIDHLALVSILAQPVRAGRHQPADRHRGAAMFQSSPSP